jgi:hypothetical protein
MKQSPDDHLTTGVASALGVLCSLLGQIPVGQQPVPAFKIPADWDAFSELDWEQLVSKAQAQGLAPLLYWVLSKSGKISSIPESSRNSLRLVYSGTWMNNQKIFRELATLAQAFQHAGIPLVVLKGACFALTIYPDIGLRPMGDLDLLVPDLKRPEVVRIAKSLGYGDAVPEASPGLNDLLNHEICLQKTGSPSITLEIHHSLVADRSFRYAVPVDWFWEQVEPLDASLLKAGDLNLLMLAPTAQVLYAASHAMLQHGGRNAPLVWFYDLDRLIRLRTEQMDWDLLLAQAKLFEWGSALEAALSKTVACFGTPIPGHVLTGLSGVSDRNQKLVALKQIQPATHVLEERQKLLSLNGYARFRLLLALIVPSPAYIRWRYRLKTSWALPAWYLFRWAGILKDAAHTVIVLIKRSHSFNKARP